MRFLGLLGPLAKSTASVGSETPYHTNLSLCQKGHDHYTARKLYMFLL